MHIFKDTVRIYFLFLIFIIGTHSVLAAPDYQREKRWADEVVPGLIVGDAIYLQQKNKHKFLSIYSEAENKKMGLVVAHGMGLHPDWGMIGTLRQDLFDYGYSTLSIQMPVLASDASYKSYPDIFPDAIERLKIAVAFLKEKGFERVVIISHSNGSRMSRGYMVSNPIDVSAWVALSLTQGDTFEGVKAPVFDLFGDNDLEHVVNTAKMRKRSFKNNAQSKQTMILDANHFFNGKESQMIDAVKAFLEEIKSNNKNIQPIALLDEPAATCGFGW